MNRSLAILLAFATLAAVPNSPIGPVQTAQALP